MARRSRTNANTRRRSSDPRNRVLQTRAVIRVLRERRPLRAPEVAASVSRTCLSGVAPGALAVIGARTSVAAAGIAGAARRARISARFLGSPRHGVASPIDDIPALFRPVARHVGGFAVLVRGQVADVLRLLANRAPQFGSGFRGQ